MGVRSLEDLYVIESQLFIGPLFKAMHAVLLPNSIVFLRNLQLLKLRFKNILIRN